MGRDVRRAVTGEVDARPPGTGSTPVTFWELLASTAERHPDRVVVADDHGRSLTSEQLRDAAERAAAGLGVRPGQIVSWQLPTVLESVVLMAALARVGAVQNPVIPILRHRDVGLITSQVGTELFVAPESWRGFAHAEMGRELGLDTYALEFDDPVGPELRLPMGDPTSLPAAPSSGDEVRWIYFSSGTTAAPKGARHTDESTMASSWAIVDQLGFATGDRYPIAWPVTHIGGIAMLTACLRAGGCLVLFDVFDPSTTPERMAAHRPTILGSALPFFRAYLDAQARHGDEPLFAELRTCTAGGAPTPPELVRELVETFGVPGVVQAYGLTEFPMATSATRDDAPDVLARSSGRVARGVQVRVVDRELRLKGAQCFRGYVDETLDEDAFDDEGWFRTGDLGHLDDTGNVYITGRLKDVIIRNAENISALEIEDVLLRHDAVADVAVVGMPDSRTGERVVAVVRAEGGAEVNLQALVEHCLTEGLARQKCPVELHFVDEMPRNPMGKVVKQQLAQALVERADASSRGERLR